MKRNWPIAIALLVLVGIGVALWRHHVEQPQALGPTENRDLTRVTINEATRTLLYLPLYHALSKGYFREAGLDVEIVTGGTATNSFAAMVSGEADFSQADPMYVPISRESGARTKVVAQVVGRIGIWAVATDPEIHDMSRSSISGKKISTHPRPMTTFTYTAKAIRDAGLEPDKDVEIIQSAPGTELVPLLSGQADFAVTVEPNISKAESEGAHVVLSFAGLLGDQILTALMTTEDYIAEHPEVVRSVVASYQRSLDDLHGNPSAAVETAREYFSQVRESTLSLAAKRMLEDEVIPRSVLVSEESWDKAIAVRVASGDLAAASARSDNCALEIMEAASANQSRN